MKKITKQGKIALIVLAALVVIAAGVLLILDRLSVKTNLTLTVEEAQTALETQLAAIPNKTASGVVYLLDTMEYRVDSVEYGEEKNIIAHVSYTTRDLKKAYEAIKGDLLTAALGCGFNASGNTVLAKLRSKVKASVDTADVLSGTVDAVFYDTGTGSPVLYLSDELINTLFGGIVDVRADISAINEVTFEDETVSLAMYNNITNGLLACYGVTNYSASVPDTSSMLGKWWNSFYKEFAANFINNNGWYTLLVGLGTTLALTGCALLAGIVIGFLTAIVRSTYEKSGKLWFLNKVFSVYIAIVRGTPVMVQLLIIYFVLLLPIGVEKFPAAVLCFGLNSGAYVSEIVRGGILSVDNGQTEAGRSLGFGFAPTMFYIVIPQAFKAVLPALCNEFIALLKETSVAFYIGVSDLTEAGLRIRAVTYSNFMPLLAVALIYLVVVLILTKLVGILERRLRKGERTQHRKEH